MRAYVLALALSLSAAAFPALAASYSISDTDIGTLLDDPSSRAIIDKHIPGFSARDQIDQARSFTLTFVQGFPQAAITDAMLKDIQADFDKLATAKK